MPRALRLHKRTQPFRNGSEPHPSAALPYVASSGLYKATEVLLALWSWASGLHDGAAARTIQAIATMRVPTYEPPHRKKTWQSVHRWVLKQRRSQEMLCNPTPLNQCWLFDRTFHGTVWPRTLNIVMGRRGFALNTGCQVFFLCGCPYVFLLQVK